MNLGTQTGSLVNHVYSRATIGQPEPTVGMGATILLWSDRHAATIVKVETFGKAKIITTRDDSTRVISGSSHDGSAEYSHTPDPKGRQRSFRAIGPDGSWHAVVFNEHTKRWNKSGETGLRIGSREEYRDPSF